MNQEKDVSMHVRESINANLGKRRMKIVTGIIRVRQKHVLLKLILFSLVN